jgi:hypothetical protein
MNAKVIQNPWVMCVKASCYDSVRFKAGLVAKCYAQKQEIDEDETSGPVTRYDTFRTLFAVTA